MLDQFTARSVLTDKEIARNRVDLDLDPSFSPYAIDDNIILNISSRGFPGFLGGMKKGSMLYDQRFEAISVNDRPGIVVNYTTLPAAENDYRQELFGARRPTVISATSDSFYESTNEDTDVLPLDRFILQNNPLFQTIKSEVTSRNWKYEEGLLYGYHQTNEMLELAKSYALRYYANPEFALWAGSKIGLQELLTQYDLPRLHTVSIFSDDDLFAAVDYLETFGYDECVMKINQSTNGIGYKVLSLPELKDSLKRSDLSSFPIGLLSQRAGIVLQGCVRPEFQLAQSSLDLLITPEDGGQLIFSKDKYHSSEDVFAPAGYLPISSEINNSIKAIAPNILSAFSAEGATGPHCINFMHVSAEGAKKYSLPEGVPMIHDENPRIGAGKLAHYWASKIRRGKAGKGWACTPATLKGKTISQVLTTLKQTGLLVTKAGEHAHGVAVYDGIFLDKGYEKFTMVAVSRNNEPLEAVEMLDRAIKALS